MAKVSLYNGHGFVELVDMMGDQHRVIEAARVSYGARTKGEEKDRRLFHYLMRHKHHGPLEHVVMTFRVRAPIYVARQHMRHRTWSYNELSRRYSKQEPDYYIPGGDNGDPPFSSYAREAANHALEVYKYGLELVSPERARDVLPMAAMTEYIATVDMRNFLHFYELRSSEHAQLEIQHLASAMHGLVMDQPNMEWVRETYELYGMDGIIRLAYKMYNAGLRDYESMKSHLEARYGLPNDIIDAILKDI